MLTIEQVNGKLKDFQELLGIEIKNNNKFEIEKLKQRINHFKKDIENGKVKKTAIGHKY